MAEQQQLDQSCQQQMTSLIGHFDQVDSGQTGLDHAQICDVMTREGFQGSSQTVGDIFEQDTAITKENFTTKLGELHVGVFKVWALRVAFHELDKDKSGFLSKDEVLSAVTKDVGLDITQDMVLEMLSFVSVEDDGDQRVSYEEFLYCYVITHVTDTMKQVFTALDTDHSGYLSRDEILAATRKNSLLRLNKQLISDLLVAWVKDKDNKVNYQEFLKVMQEQTQKPRRLENF